MAVNLERLHNELLAANLPINGVGTPLAIHASDKPVTFHQRPAELVRLTWAVAPSVVQKSQAEVVVLNHSGNLTVSEKLDATGALNRVVAALALRASASWNSATAGEKNHAQNIIDAAGANVLATIRS